MNPKTFCIAPWVHTAVRVDQTLAPCCMGKKDTVQIVDFVDWWTGDSMAQLRQDLISGIKNPICNSCWRAEDEGRVSLRQNYNNQLRQYSSIGTIRECVKNNEFRNIPIPTTWEIDIGNECNLKCIMCNPYSSNKIRDEVLDNQSAYSAYPSIVKFSINDVRNNWTSDSIGKEFLENLRHAKWVKIQGGEALTVKKIREILNYLAPLGVILNLTTNGTVLSKEILDIFKQFKKVEISLSLEAAGGANDVIRADSNWQIIKRNVDSLLKLNNIEIQINHVAQATSTLYLPDLIKFAEEYNLPVNIMPIDRFNFLSLSVCKPNLINHMIKKINDMDIKNSRTLQAVNDLKSIINNTKFNQDLLNQFVDYVNMLDSIRTEKLKPYILPIIKS